MTEHVYDPRFIGVGDLIAYPARVGPREAPPNLRDQLRVTRVEDRFVYGRREHPESWERDIEFAVYPLQLEERGVVMLERASGPGAGE